MRRHAPAHLRRVLGTEGSNRKSPTGYTLGGKIPYTTWGGGRPYRKHNLRTRPTELGSGGSPTETIGRWPYEETTRETTTPRFGIQLSRETLPNIQNARQIYLESPQGIQNKWKVCRGFHQPLAPTHTPQLPHAVPKTLTDGPRHV